MRKILMTIVGLAALVVGLLWAAQGAGLVQWPRTSFMIGETNWIYWGTALAVLGLLILWRARR
jgi:MYXO-CTERM domain-containing protein